jgi:hypothetical protein
MRAKQALGYESGSKLLYKGLEIPDQIYETEY